MRFLGYPVLLIVLGLFLAAVMALLGLVTGSTSGPKAPRDFSLAFNFLGPRTVLLCWTQSDAQDVTSYDMQVTHWNFGRTRTEVMQRIATGDCAGNLSTGRVFQADNLYHLALRACRENRCSDWTDVSGTETYWFQIPCADAKGDGCLYPLINEQASGRAP